VIPYGDDFLIFGCANSISIMFGDPNSDGQINEVSKETGILGQFAWCVDNNGNLYFMGTNGLYRMSGGKSKPENISSVKLPNLMSDWAYDPAVHRVVLTYDPERHGILISRTTIADGDNLNYWYSLKTDGFYPEDYPNECGIFCSTYFDSTTATDRATIYGSYDGYFREFLNTAKNDDAGASGDTAISSFVTMPITPMGDDKDHEGLLTWIVPELGGGAASGDFSDSDGATWEVHVASDAETCLEDIRDGATAFASGTISTVGRQNKTRVRARGAWLGVKVYNSTASETWALNSIDCDIISKGKIK
jgi:hypothetical protein